MNQWKMSELTEVEYLEALQPLQDGITHINTYSMGATKLGKFLSNFADTPFYHPEDGEFRSVEGYWYWLGCKDDRLRNTYGMQAKKLGRELGAPDWLEDDEFKRKIKLAIRSKVLEYPEAAEQLKNSTLPITHYYVFGGKVVVPKQGMWIVDYLEELRVELKGQVLT